MTAPDRPRYRVDADRQAAQRRVRYVETNRPDDGSCTLCQLDEENPAPLDRNPMTNDTHTSAKTKPSPKKPCSRPSRTSWRRPAATQATLNKLTLVGYERDECLQMMVLAHEIRAMLRDDRPFDGAAYETMLRKLPELPEASE